MVIPDQRTVEPSHAQSVAELNLPSRVENSLIRHGVQTVSQLIGRSGDDLLADVRGIGVNSIIEIEAALGRSGLGLARVLGRPRRPVPTDRHIRNYYAALQPLTGSDAALSGAPR